MSSLFYTTPFCVDSCVISAASVKTPSSFIPQSEAAQHTQRWWLFCFWILVNIFPSASWSHGLWWGAINNICPSLVSLRITEGSGRGMKRGVCAIPEIHLNSSANRMKGGGPRWECESVDPRLGRCGFKRTSFRCTITHSFFFLWHIWQRKSAPVLLSSQLRYTIIAANFKDSAESSLVSSVWRSVQNPAVQKRTNKTWNLPTDTLHSSLEIVSDIFDQCSHVEQVDMIARTYAAVQYAVWENNMEDLMKAQWQDQYRFLRLSHGWLPSCVHVQGPPGKVQGPKMILTRLHISTLYHSRTHVVRESSFTTLSVLPFCSFENEQEETNKKNKTKPNTVCKDCVEIIRPCWSSCLRPMWDPVSL